MFWSKGFYVIKLYNIDTKQTENITATCVMN